MIEESHRPNGQDINAAQERLSEVAHNVRNTASQFGRRATERIEETRQATASRLRNTAGTLHQTADGVSHATHRAAERVDAIGNYLNEHSVKDMMSDVQTVMRRHPGKTLLISLLAGILVGKALSSERD